MTNQTTNDSLLIHTYAEDAYLRYAMATVKERAMGQVEDGKKPVHRRILFAMKQLGLNPDTKPVKSARIVGDVLGKYHPHGDTAAYDAMVRMAQPFSLRYPLVAGQGNFGSRDGDSAAAMRYTEARLAPISSLLLDELGQGTVDFVKNYDGTHEEPALLPSRLPFTLLNGTSGIAVGMASNIPSHNLREVALAAILAVENPDVTLEQLLEVMPGPDFPDGGQLISSPEDIRAVYESGRGPLRVRARWKKEELARGQWQLVVYEMSYQISPKKVLEEIEVLANPQIPSGKKALTQQQLNLKALALDFLENARDESGKADPIRLVIVPRTSKVDPDSLMAFLLANTSLEENFSMNANLIGLDGNPSTKGLLAILKEWAEFRQITVRRRTEHELSQAEKRMHILQGRLTAFRNLDAIIDTIRESDDPKPELMARFSLSEVQADDILEMRLRQLNRLEGVKLEREIADLSATITRLGAILASPQKLKSLVVKEIKADAEKYGDDRRTLIKPEEKRMAAVPIKSVLEEPITVVVSKNLWVKAYKGVGLQDDAFAFKAGDQFAFKAEGLTTQPVSLMDTKGRVYSFSSAEVPTKGEGAPLSSLVELQSGAKLFALLSGEGEAPYLFASSAGYGFVAPLKSTWARPRAGKAFLTLGEGETPLAPLLLSNAQEGHIACIASNAKMLAFDVKEAKVLPNGGKGVMLMALDSGDSVLEVRRLVEARLTLSLRPDSGKTFSATIEKEEWLKYVGKRARKGAYLPKKGLPT